MTFNPEINFEGIFAGAALIASGVSLYKSIKHEKKLNSINLISDFYLDVFKEFLINDIPIAREKLRFSGNKLTGSKDLFNVLGKMKRKSLFFLYTNRNFFKNLKKEIDELEKYISDSSNKTVDSSEQTEIMNMISTKIEKLFGLIISSLTNN